MNVPPLRVRFAPSPTGELHLGNARTALLNWLLARHGDGRFILRIEDTDRTRSTPAFEAQLLEDLRWLGLTWDEGPDVGGPCGPYRQSERSGYAEALQRLVAAGAVYPCYCSAPELEAERTARLAQHLMPRYGGRCRTLSDSERRQREREGRRPLWRFRVPEGEIAFEDLLRGTVRFQGEAIGDFVIVRSNGVPAYNFAVVVDDHQMAISHVVRGEDHLSNTAAQLLLYRALAFPPPRFAHHALILGQDRAKLSKRDGAVSVGAFRRQGFLPEVLLQGLALLGGSLAEAGEVTPAAGLVAAFSLAKVGKSGAVFDESKLRGLNGLYLRRLALPELADRLAPFIAAAGRGDLTGDRGRLEAVVDALRDNLTLLSDVADLLPIVSEGPSPPDGEAAALLRSEEARVLLRALRGRLATPLASGGGGETAMPPEGFAALVKAVGAETGYRGRRLYLPIRAALTGRLAGPELHRVFPLLSPATLKARIEAALAP